MQYTKTVSGLLVSGWACVVLCSTVSFALGDVSGASVDVYSNATESTLSGEYAVSQTIDLPLYPSTPGEVAIFGADVSLRCKSDDFRIAGVVAHAPFVLTTQPGAPALPAKNYHFAAAQPELILDDALGILDTATPLATITLEILNGEAFESNLEIKAQGALVGVSPDLSYVHGLHSEQTPQGGKACIRITNTTALPAQPATDPLPDLPEYTAPAGIALYEIDGTQPVHDLTANTTYELHVSTGADAISGYVLFCISEYADECITAATPAGEGAWSATGLFSTIDLTTLSEEPIPAFDYPTGFFRRTMISDGIASGERGTTGPSDSYLCKITTGAAGELSLDLFVDYLDLTNGEWITMQTSADFDVYEN